MRLVIEVFLVSCLAVTASEDTLDLGKTSASSLKPTLDTDQGYLDPVIVSSSDSGDGEVRSTRRTGSARPSAAQRWYSMIQGMMGGKALQPFWLPCDAMALDGAAAKRHGQNGVFVLPVPVQVSADESFDDELQPDEWAPPAWIGGSNGGGLRRPPSTRPAATPPGMRAKPRPQAPRPSLREYEPPYAPARPVPPTPPPQPPLPPTDEDLLLQPPPVESSRELVKQFREQIDSIPYEYYEPLEETLLDPFLEQERPALEKPAAVVARRRRQRAAVSVSPSPGPSPVQRHRRAVPAGPLTFPRPLSLRGEVYVRNSQYKEPFKVWEDASGATRTELHGGAATAFRTPLPGNQVQLKLIQVERSSGREIWKCAVTPPFPYNNDAALQRHPALPDVTNFVFVGFVRRGEALAEVWRWEQTGEPGKKGAAPEEVLTFRHEIIVMRGPNNIATPLKYTLKVDSSVLGANSDGYEVRYSPVTSPSPGFDLDSSRCDDTETLSATSPDDLARLEPLREFTGSARDPRYDAIIAKFKSGNHRSYTDSAEESVRKNLVMQNSRFVASGNRAGQSFALGTNFLSDRLDTETAKLSGVKVDVSTLPPAPFPYSDKELSELAKDLPLEFDWREHNGVTSVRFQGLSCKSCWAFAVTGAVEGARFIRTKELRALSEQSLVDCAKPYLGGGCKGTWPEHAYEYVSARGLPELDSYPYNGTVNPCRAEARPLPATRIGGYANVPPNNIDAIKVAIRLQAPVVVLVDVNTKNFSNYKTGALNVTNCKKTKEYLKHAMLAVGWDNENGHTNLIIKNSWTNKWGDHGYVRMQATGNTCGVLTLPTYPVLDLQDVFDDTSTLE